MKSDDGVFFGGTLIGIFVSGIVMTIILGLWRLDRINAVDAHVGRYVISPDGVKEWKWGVWKEEKSK